MLRTRGALLDAAATCVSQIGVRRTTMSEIAATGGVAKATLYNHFRTKDDVLAALVESRVAALGAACAALAAPDPLLPDRPHGLAVALQHAAEALGGSRPLRRVAADEPALLVPLAVPGEHRAWAQAREAVEAVLSAAGAPTGRDEVELVLRWLLSQLLWPGAGGVEALVRGLLPRASGVPPQGTSPASADPASHPAGLGWPGGPDRLRTS
jgi:AcrR family transcriptional regulator